MSTRAQTVAVPADGWRRALLALVVLLLAILVLYRQTAMIMVETWVRSETFNHAFLVPPITLWLIWRIRDNVALLPPRPNLWALLVLAGTGFAWLLGELAAVGVVSQFALTTLLVLAVPTVLGVPVTRRIAFPLAFLYFAVPFGEFAMPQFMEWTANVTVLALRFSGIPVYREGLQFIIPSGSWSVVEACSGVRYLISSLTIGTLFAYLSYHSLKRRLLFVGVAFVVPLVANWMRAYMIVMIGHLSNNKLAAGVDHLIYGWLFFGVVIMAMLWIGARWREDELQPVDAQPDDSSAAGGTNSSPWIVALVAFVLAMIWPLAQWQIERSLPPKTSQLEPLGSIAGWPAAKEPLADWSPKFDNASAVLQSTFGTDERLAGLYIAYYRNQDYSHKMVSSNNVLVRSDDSMWARVAGGSRQITFAQQSISVRSAELRSTDSSRLVVWQWYWVNGYLTSSDYTAKAYTAFSRLIGQGDDSAVIIVYAPKEQAGGGEEALDAFIAAAAPEIQSVLRRTREKR